MKTVALGVVLTLLVGCSQEIEPPADDSSSPVATPDEGGQTSDADSEIETGRPDGASAPEMDAGPQAGAAMDGGEAGTGGPAPAADAGWYLTATRCPRDVLPASSGTVGGSSVPQHPMTYVDVIRGAELVQTDALRARWTAVRKQATPVVRPCLPAFSGTSAELPCAVDSLIELTTNAGAKIEILIGLSHADLARFADGREVSLRLGPSVTAPDGSPSRSLEIREQPSDILLLAVRATQEQALMAFAWDDLQLGFGALQCVAERDFCLRVFVSRKLAVTSAGTIRDLDPGQSIEVRSAQRDYRVTHRRAVERAYGAFDQECDDLSLATASVELVQLP